MNKIIERLELNTEEGKYIKCNHCGRLSPEQKYCKYCFNELMQGGDKSEVRQIYISRGKNYSPVSDFSRMREKIDSEFTTSEIDFASLGLTEEEYNLKYTPPAMKAEREEYAAAAVKTEVSAKFDEAYRRYERRAEDAYKASQEPAEKESVKQIINDTPSSVVFNIAAEKDEPIAARQAERVYTVRRESERFKLSFLSFGSFAMSLLMISTLFLHVLPDIFGMDVISAVPDALGLSMRQNPYIEAAGGHAALVIASLSYMLLSALNLYQFFSFAYSVLTDKKQKPYAGFVMSFTSLLAGVVVLFTWLIGGFPLSAFTAGAVVLFVAAIIHFICSAGRLLKE